MRKSLIILISSLLLFNTAINLTAQETRVSTVHNTTLINSFKASSANYDLVNIDGRSNVVKIKRGDCDWNIISVSLANFKGKPVNIRFSADVMRIGNGEPLYWNINNAPEYPMIAGNHNAASRVWHRMSGRITITPENNDPILYLSTYGNDDPNTLFYFDNLSVTLEGWDYRPTSTLSTAGESGRSRSRNYYVSASSGNDNGNGTKAKPFQKISHAMHYASPGDIVFVDSGTYYERFRIPSGSSRRPITLTAMPNANVVITPTIPITPVWRQHRDNIWVADISQYVKDMDTEFPQLFADGDSMVEARFPNMGPSMSTIMDYKRDVAQRGTNKNTIVTSRDIPSNITGARVLVWTGSEGLSGWGAFMSPVQSVNGRSVRLLNELTGDVDPFSLADTHTPQPGNPFYITGALALLDAPGEYYFDSQTNLLYFYPPWNGRPDVKTLSLRSFSDTAIFAENSSHITISNIAIYGGGINMKNSSNNILENCRVKYAEHYYLNHGWSATYFIQSKMIVTGESNKVSGCEFGPTAGNGIELAGNNNVFTNNIVHNSNYAGNDFAGVFVKQSRNLEISHNTIINSARAHIVFHARETFNRCIIRNNYLENNGVLCSDNGAIYTWSTNGGGTEIYNNYVVNNDKGDNGTMHRIRNGIYIDNYCSNYIVRNNIIIGGDYGLAINLPNNGTRYSNNTAMNTREGIAFYSYEVENADAKGVTVTNNLFVGINGNDIWYVGTENGVRREYMGNFINGTIPVTTRQETRMTSSGNTRGIIGSQFRPIENTPDGVGAIPRNGQLFSYGANWRLEDRR